MQAVGVSKGQLCLPVAQVFNRHAHISKLRTLPLYHTASISGFQFNLKLQPSHGLLQVFASVKEHTKQNDSGTKAVKVKFVLQRRCEFGQQFCVIGDEELLGAWAPEAAIPMQWSEGHIWTAEQDLSVGTCMEFKIVLMAEQEVIEWQPGPNLKVEFQGSPSSLVVFVPWSDEESRGPQPIMAVNEHVRTQDDVGTASSAGKLPAWEKNVESEIFSNKSSEVMEEQLSEEKNTNDGMNIINAKDVSDEQQMEGNGIVIRHREATKGSTSFISELKLSDFTSLFAIPECWYGEEFEQTSDNSSTHDLVEPSHVSPKEIMKGKIVSSDFQFFSDNNKEENVEKLMSSNSSDEVRSDDSASSMSEPISKDKNDGKVMSLNRSDEVISDDRASSISKPISKDVNDEEQRVGDVLVEVISKESVASSMSETSEGGASSIPEPIIEEENDGEQKLCDVVVKVTSQKNVGILLSDTKIKDTDVEPNKKHELQNGSAQTIAEIRSETIVSPAVSDSQDQSEKEAVIDSDSTVLNFEVPKTEKPSMTTDLLEKVETKPSMAAKRKKRGQTGWSKLWDAFVHGRIN